jgi:hypothetical protein
MSSTVETFTLDLGNGTRCTAQVDIGKIAALPPDKFSSIIATKWEGPEEPSQFDHFQVWIANLWQYVADKANKSVCSILVTPRRELVAIVCEPGQRPAFERVL